MYLSHFHLDRDPFSLTPDPRFLYMSERHREALAHLLYGLGERGGFVQLTGEVGTGKTTLCRSLLDQVPDGVDVALILNPRLSALELVSTICDELEVFWPTGTQSLKLLVDLLNQHLLETHAKGRRTVLVIDEAQQLSADVLEQVRLLTNLETPTAKLLQIVLIGQPELQTLMARSDLRQLSQRVTARYHLEPLLEEETAEYVHHRLQVAGGKDSLFTAGALRRVHRLSGGVPRLINVICDRALLGAYARGETRVTARLVSIAGTEVMGKGAPQRKPAVWVAAAAAAAVAAAVALWASPSARSAVLGRLAGPSAGSTPAPAAASAPTPPQASAQPASDRLPTIEEWLSASGAATTPQDAAAGLFRLWHLPPPAGDDLRARASAAGLETVEGKGGWSEVELYNRPALLELSVNGSLRYVIVIGVEAGSAVLQAGDRKARAPRGEVERLWTGRFTLLWNRPPVASPLLWTKSAGPEVRWVEERLDLYEGRRPSKPASRPEEARFHPGLKKRVVAFQRSFGLPADGRVGPRTLIQLNAVSADPAVPVLRYLGGRS